MRFCSICKEPEDKSPWGADHSRCLSCLAERRMARYYANQEEEKRKALEYFNRNREKILTRNRLDNKLIRSRLFSHYGGKCVCCGESDDRFLTMDHTDGGGRKHRATLSGGAKGLYRWIIKNGYPQNFQVLCYNCNCGKHRNGGTCPHEES